MPDAGLLTRERESPRRLRRTALLAGAPVREGNAAEVLRNGDETFAAVLEAVAGAETFVALSAHVFWGDIARDIAGALAERARHGVACFVLLDGLQTIKTDAGVLAGLRRAGVQVVRARLPWRHPLQINRRLHRNVVITDGDLAIVGGVGIGDDWRSARRDAPFRDRDVALRGPIVEDVLGSFLEEWLEATGSLPASISLSETGAPSAVPGTAPMFVLRSRAATGTSSLERALRVVIDDAASRVDIATAYFVPPRPIRTALAAAARRGVQVRVLVPGKHANRTTSRRAGQALYGELLTAGVEVYEYRPSMLHAKTMVVDEGISIFGSANLDNRSLRLDDELVVLAADAALAEELTAEVATDLERSERVDPDRWRSRPLRRRATERAVLTIRRDL